MLYEICCSTVINAAFYHIIKCTAATSKWNTSKLVHFNQYVSAPDMEESSQRATHTPTAVDGCNDTEPEQLFAL